MPESVLVCPFSKPFILDASLRSQAPTKYTSSVSRSGRVRGTTNG